MSDPSRDRASSVTQVQACTCVSHDAGTGTTARATCVMSDDNVRHGCSTTIDRSKKGPRSCSDELGGRARTDVSTEGRSNAAAVAAVPAADSHPLDGPTSAVASFRAGSRSRGPRRTASRDAGPPPELLLVTFDPDRGLGLLRGPKGRRAAQFLAAENQGPVWSASGGGWVVPLSVAVDAVALAQAYGWICHTATAGAS